DLVGIMTPAMSATQLTLGRKTAVIDAGLRDRVFWGERFTLRKSEREKLYEQCYPPTPAELSAGRTNSVLAQPLIDRRRERATLDSQKELATYLRSIREERKAIVTVSEGWLLYKPDMTLTDLRKSIEGKDPIPGVDPPIIGPGGKITTTETRREL